MYVYKCHFIKFKILFQSKESDLSTAESGSDVDDVLSPQSSIVHHPTLTPVREEVLLFLSVNLSTTIFYEAPIPFNMKGQKQTKI